MRSKPLCVIVDDEESGLAALRSNLEDLDLLEIEKAYLDPDKFLVQLHQLKAKIIFLDMEMPISGVEVAQALRDKHVIFVSGKTERGFEAFDVRAIDFVPKPIRQSRLKQAIEKALTLLKPEKIVVKSQDTKREEIAPEKICCIRTGSDSRDKEIHLINGKTILAKNISFKELMDQLPNSFLQVNPGDVVNLDYVNKLLNSDTLGIQLPDSEKVIEITLGLNSREVFFQRKPQFK